MSEQTSTDAVETDEEKRSLTNRLSFGLLDRPHSEKTESSESAE
jgi:hypothetical protein